MRRNALSRGSDSAIGIRVRFRVSEAAWVLVISAAALALRVALALWGDSSKCTGDECHYLAIADTLRTRSAHRPRSMGSPTPSSAYTEGSSREKSSEGSSSSTIVLALVTTSW